MTPRASWTWPAVLLAATLVPLSTVAQPDSSGYTGIPDGFDFPADKATLEEARLAQNLSAARQHGKRGTAKAKRSDARARLPRDHDASSGSSARRHN